MPYVAGPFLTQHIYVQWGGKLPGGEEWSCGVRMGSAVPGTPMQNEDAVDNLTGWTTAIQALHQRATTKISAAAKLSFVKANVIGVNGLYTQQVTHEQVLADIAGAGVGTQPANQVACVATLLTDFSRGPANKGRIFLPLPTAAVGADGLISADDAADIKASLATWRTAMNAVDAGIAMMVMSRKSGAPATRAVTGFAVGRVLDTQRRRRRSLAENYA